MLVLLLWLFNILDKYLSRADDTFQAENILQEDIEGSSPRSSTFPSITCPYFQADSQADSFTSVPSCFFFMFLNFGPAFTTLFSCRVFQPPRERVQVRAGSLPNPRPQEAVLSAGRRGAESEVSGGPLQRTGHMCNMVTWSSHPRCCKGQWSSVAMPST